MDAECSKPPAGSEMTRRVCVIAKYPYPNETRLRQQARALADAGFCVDVLCLRFAGQAAVERSGNIEVHRLMLPGSKESLGKYARQTLGFFLKVLGRLLSLSWRRRYDAVVAHTLPELLVVSGLAHRLLGRAVFLDIRDLSLELFESKWGQSALRRLRPFFRAMEWFSCVCARHVIVASPGFEQRLIQRGVNPDKLTVIYNSADVRVFPLWEGRAFHRIENNARLLYHGTVAKRFGLQVAIEAMPAVCREIPGSELHVYGILRGGIREHLDRQIHDLGLDKAVCFHECVTLERINEVFREMDMEVVPYLSDDFMNLAFSTKMFECASAGLPIVASRLQPAQWVFDDECVEYAAPGDAADFAAKIVGLCRNPERRRQMVRKAHASHERVSSDVMERRCAELFQRLTGSRQRVNV